MEQPERVNGNEHVIDIRSSVEVASSRSVHGRVDNQPDPSHTEDRPSSNARAAISQLSLPISNVSASENSPSSSRGVNAHSRRRRRLLCSHLLLNVDLFLTLAQIVASVIVLSLSGHEHPQTPLFAWILVYAAGCVATLPHLYWSYLLENLEYSVQSRQSSSSGSTTAQNQEGDNRTAGSSSRSAIVSGAWIHNVMHKACFKIVLYCFFASWFVVGNVWVFGGHASASETPNLYRLCVAFLIISFIRYAILFTICATFCCSLPCIIYVFREDIIQRFQPKGATTELINALPIYKFKLEKSRNSDDASGAGVVAAGTEKERVISGEDAVCCICLAEYKNNDDLRELQCSHLFHKDCVGKWLKISGLCPLCKAKVRPTVLGSLAAATANLRRAESRVGRA